MSKAQHSVIRTCVGCRQKFSQKGLLRLTRAGKEGRVILNLEQKSVGRSVYLCRQKKCFQRAVRRKGTNALVYGLKVKVDEAVVAEAEKCCEGE